MDSFDRKILAALQRDGTLTNAALSEEVNLSPSQCSRRRAALEEAGLIAGYHARLDAAKLGIAMRAIVRVTLRSHGRADHQTLADWFARQPEVAGAFSVSGNADYILDIRVRDLEQFSDFIHDRLMVQPLIGQIQSDFVMRTIKDDGALDVSSVG